MYIRSLDYVWYPQQDKDHQSSVSLHTIIRYGTPPGSSDYVINMAEYGQAVWFRFLCSLSGDVSDSDD